MRTPEGMPDAKNIKPEYMRPNQVEKAFGLKATTVRSWVPRRLSGVRIGRTVLVNVSDLRSRLSRVEAGEPWENVFCEPSSNFGHCSHYPKEGNA